MMTFETKRGSKSVRRPNTAGVLDTDYHENRYARLLDKYVRPGARWLDLGTGARMHGAWLGPSQEELALRAKLLIGTDVHVQHMRENRSLNSAVSSNAQWLPFQTESFDVVSANMVVEHLEHPSMVFAEVARLLGPGGVFILSTPNRHNPVVLVSAWILAARWRRLVSHALERRDLDHIFPTHYRCNTVADITRTAESTGLRVREMEVFSSFPFAKQVPGLAQAEGLLIRVLRNHRLRSARSNILAVLERPGIDTLS